MKIVHYYLVIVVSLGVLFMFYYTYAYYDDFRLVQLDYDISSTSTLGLPDLSDRTVVLSDFKKIEVLSSRVYDLDLLLSKYARLYDLCR